MTYKQIIKGLECCKTANCSDCKGCPYNGKSDSTRLYVDCCNLLITDALDLINRQKAEIERLEADLKVKNQVLKDRELTPYPFNNDHERRTSYLHLVNRQQAEIVKLEAETDRLNYILQCYALEYGTAVDKERFLKPARSEAVKEFAERLKQKETTAISCKRFEGVVSTDDIDNLVKEFTEGGNDG